MHGVTLRIPDHFGVMHSFDRVFILKIRNKSCLGSEIRLAIGAQQGPRTLGIQ